jgi:hypothetical protein
LLKFRVAGMQVSPVTMSCHSLRTTAPPCLPLGRKDSLKEDTRLFAFWVKGGFCFLGEGRLWLLDEARLFDVGGFGREMNC